jgi:Na+/melibiose symporter-like transporter
MCEERPEFQKDESFPLWKSIKETTKSKSYLLFVGFNFTFVFAQSLGISYLFLYGLILGNNATVSIIYFAIFVFVGYTSYIVCMKLRPKWGMRKVILRFGLVRVIGTVIAFIIALLIPSEPSIWILWIGFVWWTFFGGYGVYVPGPLMYLSVDDDEIKHGIRREGMFLGINALFTKPAMSLGPIIATLILIYFGYIQGADTQSASTLIGIKILFLLIPAIATAIGLIFMYFYPFYGERLREMREKLEDLHKEKLEKIQ